VRRQKVFQNLPCLRIGVAGLLSVHRFDHGIAEFVLPARKRQLRRGYKQKYGIAEYAAECAKPKSGAGRRIFRPTAPAIKQNGEKTA
jgi:hypothetical protein